MNSCFTVHSHRFLFHCHYKAEEEETEAKIQQKKKAEILQLEDFGVDDQADEEQNHKIQTAVKLIEEQLEDEETQKIRDVSNLSISEKLQILKNDSPELFQLLKDFQSNIEGLRERIQPVIEK
jgi:flagellar biosynthesis GTPase FlhF